MILQRVWTVYVFNSASFLISVINCYAVGACQHVFSFQISPHITNAKHESIDAASMIPCVKECLLQAYMLSQNAYIASHACFTTCALV